MKKEKRRFWPASLQPHNGIDALRKYATLLFLGSAIAAVILISLLREPLNHVIEVLLASKPVPVSAAVLFLLLIICIFNIAVSLFTFGALFLLKDILREVGEKLPKRRRKEDDEK